MSDPAADGRDTSPLVERSFAQAGASNAAGEGDRGDVTITRSPALAGGDDDENVYNDPEPGSDSEPEPMPDFAEGEEDDDVEPYVEDIDEQSPDEEQVEPSSAIKPVRESSKPKKRQRRISKYGIEYPALPPTFVKRVAQTALQSSGLSNPRVSADTLTALTQASEWFFEQLGDDLGAYANHAGRKTIEESDTATLMRRYVVPIIVSQVWLYFG